MQVNSSNGSLQNRYFSGTGPLFQIFFQQFLIPVFFPTCFLKKAVLRTCIKLRIIVNRPSICPAALNDRGAAIKNNGGHLEMSISGVGQNYYQNNVTSVKNKKNMNGTEETGGSPVSQSAKKPTLASY